MAYKTHIKSYITHVTDSKGQEIQEIVEILTDLWAGGLTRQNFNFFSKLKVISRSFQFQSWHKDLWPI